MTEEQKEEQFEFVVKMAVIIKELMNGCDNLDPKFSEEAIGHNAIWQLASRDRDSGLISIRMVTLQRLC